MKSAPRFSVVIPAYNEADVVTRAIASVRAQTVADWEAIVVDDGSTDRTAAVVEPVAEADARVRLVSKPNRGLSAARNAGIDAATAPLISFLDADDFWLPRYLESMGAVFSSASDVGIACTDAWALDLRRGRFRRSTAMAPFRPPVFPVKPVETMRQLLRQNYIWVSVTARRQALEAAGLFRTELASVEDLDLWLRILGHGYRLVGPVGVLGVKGERTEQMSRRVEPMIEALLKVVTHVSEDSLFPDEVRNLAGERRKELQRSLRAVTGADRRGALRGKARRAAGGLFRASVGRLRWRRTPPPPVRDAYGAAGVPEAG